MGGGNAIECRQSVTFQLDWRVLFLILSIECKGTGLVNVKAIV